MSQANVLKVLFAAWTTAMVAGAALPALAGSTGNGTVEAAQTHYSYCFGGNRGKGIVYFSGVITSAPAAGAPALSAPFDGYLHQTYGPTSSTGSTCVASVAMADILNAKKKREAEFTWEKWKIVETNWGAQ